MQVRKFLVALIAPIYSLMVAALILIGTATPYDAFEGEVSNGKVTTFCDLPTEGDDTSDVFMPITGILVFTLLLVGVIRSYRARRIRPTLIYGVLLLLMWAYYFFLRRLGC
jgi:hypothetical protein